MTVFSLLLAILTSAIGPDGWTVLAPSPDSRMVYVSGSSGLDTNDGLSEAKPLKTIRFALGKIRSGYPDWLLVKCGDTFKEGTISWEKRGRSETEPIVVTSYGTGPRPILNQTALSYYWNTGFPAGFSLDYLTIVGLDFQGDIKNAPTVSANNVGLLMSGPMTGIIFEDNKVSGYASGVNVQLKSLAAAGVNAITFRRNVVCDNANFGVLVSGGNSVLIDSNVFDHNGWGDAGPTQLKHNVYLKEVNDATLRDNIFARGGNFGTKLSSDKPGAFKNFVIENNLYYNNGIGLDHSAGATGDVQTTFTHEGGSVSRNVFTESGRTFANGVSQDLVGYILNTKNVTWSKNLFVHKPPVSTGVILNWGQHHKDITVSGSVVYDWNLVSTLPPSAYLDYKADQVIDGYLSVDNEINLPAEHYVDPSRSVGSYYASIGGENDAVAFLTAAMAVSKATWNPAFTAGAVNDYIREGLTAVIPPPPVDPPVEPPVEPPIEPPSTGLSRLEAALVAAAKVFIFEMEK